MYPGLSDADCQVADLHYRQLVNEGQRQQFSLGAPWRPASRGWCPDPCGGRLARSWSAPASDCKASSRHEREPRRNLDR